MAIGDHEEMIYYLNGVQKNRALPLLSIGQMITCLAEQDTKLSIHFKGSEWVIALDNEIFQDADLCSALFEAIKVKL